VEWWACAGAKGWRWGNSGIDYGLSRRRTGSACGKRLQPFLEEGLLLIEGDRLAPQ